MRKVLSVVGTRPNLMKTAPVIKALARREIDQVLVHTGQHYDASMSDVFFDDFAMPEPDYFLEVGSGTHAQQTARVIERLEPVLVAEPARHRARARRRQLDAGSGARRGQARDPGRPHRSGPAQLRLDDAGGAEPRRHGRRLGP